MSGCETCDQIDPDITRTTSNFRDAPRYMHDLGRAIWAGLVKPWAQPAVRWLDRAFTR